MSFLTALSGLNAATSNLGVISNNIANANTAGFKESRAEFADVFNGGRIGTGVNVSDVAQQFRQGSVDGTGNPLDLAIDGQGFFQVRDQGGTYYTRAGQFSLDKDGFVVNSGGQKLQGYTVTQITNSDGSVEDRLTGTIGNIKIENGDAPPRPTSRIDFGANLSADAEAPTVTPFDAASPDTYNHSTSLPVYDSQGNQHTMSLYFVKDGNAANTWAVHFTLTDKAGTTTPGSAAATLSYTDNGTFDMTAGTPTADIEFDLSGFSTATKPQGAASPLQIKMDFSSTTQFGGASSTNALSQNGYSSGRLVGVEVDDKGQVQGRYSNGENKLLGQVSLFDFRNVQGLEPVGDSNWVQTSASGEAVPGAAQTASLGSVVSAALESSNVEMTKELVKMISAQRSFQANAQVISASDQMQQTILQTMR